MRVSEGVVDEQSWAQQKVTGTHAGMALTPAYDQNDVPFVGGSIGMLDFVWRCATPWIEISGGLGFRLLNLISSLKSDCETTAQTTADPTKDAGKFSDIEALFSVGRYSPCFLVERR
jgi:hypothetical protein